jgi:predicted 3-demethylubiquinone-9 3-methyltransferase (glyoxalase superfamily)
MGLLKGGGMKKIVPCLWFDDKAEEAAKFYVSLIKNSKIGSITRYSAESAAAAGRSVGSVMTVTFKLNGQEFMALNGGPVFTFTPAVSFMVNCDTQREIDRLWEKLSAGGEKSVCGWLTDKYGVSWQIVPTVLNKLMTGRDPERAKRVMQALLKMTKLDIAGLKKAYAQR